MLIGLAISIGFIIYRYGKQGRGGTGGTTPRASTEGDDR
jgi:hypothetical protein